ncbi:MAG: TetR family transcriptional regulator [Parvularculaceae bacterium]
MKKASATPRDKGLSREAVAAAALALIEEEGLARFSTRRLAARLGLQAMSLYHYFPNRGALTEAVVDRMIAEVDLPQILQCEWRAGLIRLARGFRVMGLRHIAAVPLLAERSLVSPAMDAFVDSIGKFLLGAGLRPPIAAQWLTILKDSIVGSLGADHAVFLQAQKVLREERGGGEETPNGRIVFSTPQLAWRNRVFEKGFVAFLDAIQRDASR